MKTMDLSPQDLIRLSRWATVKALRVNPQWSHWREDIEQEAIRIWIHKKSNSLFMPPWWVLIRHAVNNCIGGVTGNRTYKESELRSTAAIENEARSRNPDPEMLVIMFDVIEKSKDKDCEWVYRWFVGDWHPQDRIIQRIVSNTEE
jgi:hypothetical protein